MAEPLRLLIDHLKTPIGELMIVSDDDASIRAIDWQEFQDRMLRKLASHYDVHGWTLTRARDAFGHTSAMAAYMEGNIAMLDSVAVKTGGTPFQRMVWSALREIPAGAPTSYGELAKSIGRASAVRAVGLANGANPIGIVVPCHRVIGANGSLTGYGGGLERKQWLLAHEARHALAPSEQLSSTACDAAVTMPTASRCAFEAPRASASATTPAMSSPARSPRTPAA